MLAVFSDPSSGPLLSVLPPALPHPTCTRSSGTATGRCPRHLDRTLPGVILSPPLSSGWGCPHSCAEPSAPGVPPAPGAPPPPGAPPAGPRGTSLGKLRKNRLPQVPVRKLAQPPPEHLREQVLTHTSAQVSPQAWGPPGSRAPQTRPPQHRRCLPQKTQTPHCPPSPTPVLSAGAILGLPGPWAEAEDTPKSPHPPPPPGQLHLLSPRSSPPSSGCRAPPSPDCLSPPPRGPSHAGASSPLPRAHWFLPRVGTVLTGLRAASVYGGFTLPLRGHEGHVSRPGPSLTQ